MTHIENKSANPTWPSDWIVEVRKRSQKNKRKSLLKYPWLRHRDGKMLVVVEELGETD